MSKYEKENIKINEYLMNQSTSEKKRERETDSLGKRRAEPYNTYKYKFQIKRQIQKDEMVTIK